jgi:transcriptional regulator with GAF, ATPase, and Fis domain
MSFVKVNCGAIPHSLLEAELFGYERGAFTGAAAAHKGYFEQAHGGTLFLDEIAELSLMAQVRLLRVLESREVQRLGGQKSIPLDFRLLAATNRDVDALMERGKFRTDLWYRISPYIIQVPPLARRKEDIPVLAAVLARSCAAKLGTGYVPEISPQVTQTLLEKPWPGNVRELRNWMERAILHTAARRSMTLIPPDEEHSAFAASPRLQRVPAPDPPHAALATMEDATRRHIILALRQCNGRIQGKGSASELLDVNPGTLRSRMKKLGITTRYVP